MTDEDPAAALARLEAQIATLSEAKAKLVRMVELEAELRRLKAEVAVPGDSPLHMPTKDDTLAAVNTSAISNVRRSKAALRGSRRRHPFVAMLLEKGLTVAKVALAIDRPRSTVQAWYKGPRDLGYREIPYEAAEKIRELYGLPHDAWHSVGPKE